MASLLNMARAFFDIPAALNCLGYTDKFPNKVGGFFGAVTSSISLYNLWGR